MIRASRGAVHLDTSFLIRALDPAHAEAAQLVSWLSSRRSIAVSTLAWGEFLCGPVSVDDEAVARRLLDRRIPLGTEEATVAARLFNHGGRRRHSLPDCVIAATAILAGAELATSNRQDFRRFTDAGLVLAE